MFNQEDIMPMLTVKDVALLLNIHVNTTRPWSDQGMLKAYRITRRGDHRFRQEDITSFLEEYNHFNMNKSAIMEFNTVHG